MSVGESSHTVQLQDRPTFFDCSLFVSPTEILDGQSIGNFELGIGDFDDALYNNAISDVDCINLICNKKISNGGRERSVGRPGNSPIGARNAERQHKTCLGPYATWH